MTRARAGNTITTLIAATLLAGACGDSSTGGGGGGGGGGADAGPPGYDGGTCFNLACQQTTCQPGVTTTLTGTVYNPSGELPLYNVFVYVPNTPLDPISTGPSCDRCETPLSGDPLVHAVTDAAGRFVLENVPAGENIPLVIQIGKWQRVVSIPGVAGCETRELPAELTRLPRNQREGHLPRIALTTGSADALECFLKKMGIDQEEFTPEAGTGRVNLFGGRGGTDQYRADWNGGVDFTTADDWWDPGNTNDVNRLMEYDVVLHSCEGTENPTNKSVRAREALREYVDVGGRVFASHWHNYWLREGAAPLDTVGEFNLDLPDPGDPGDPVVTATIQTGFAKGRALADWMMNVGGSTTFAELPLSDAEHTLVSIDPQLATTWIQTTTLDPVSLQYVSFNTPVGAAESAQCGRVVFSDIHVSSGDDSSGSLRFPAGCTTTGLTPEEKALAFMLFDLSGCITADIPID